MNNRLTAGTGAICGEMKANFLGRLAASGHASIQPADCNVLRAEIAEGGAGWRGIDCVAHFAA
jgi:hypothetical protein